MENLEFKYFKTVDIRRMQKEIDTMRKILGFLETGEVNSDKFAEKDLLNYCRSLVSRQRKLTKTFKGGSWAVVPLNEHIPPDARVEFVFTPTYFAVAILTRTQIEFPHIAEKIKGFSDALKKGMAFCTHRGLQGSGYEVNFYAVKILSAGRVVEFLKANPKFCPELLRIFRRIGNYAIHNLREGRTTGVWGENIIEELRLISPAAICNEFILNFCRNFKIEPKKTLLFLSGLQALKPLEDALISNVIFDNNDIPSEKFDLVVGEFPFGRRAERYKNEEKNIDITTSPDWIILLRLLFLLSKKGRGLFLVEPRFVYQQANLKFIELLKSQGFYINGFVCCPEGMLLPETALRPNLVIISKESSENVFVGELTHKKKIEDLLDTFSRKSSSDRIEKGVFIEGGTWRGLRAFKAEREVSKLLEGYKDWDKCAIKELAEEFLIGKQNQDFVEKPNSILFPNIGVSPVVVKISEAKNKPQNYFQISLKEEIVLAKYLGLFFNSEMGRALRKSLETGGVIRHINKREAMEAKVPIPPLKIQENIVKTDKMISAVKEKLVLFESELALSPKSSTEIRDQIENILEVLNELTEADKIRSLIRKGETKTIEFKQTLSLDVKTKTKQNYIELAVLKTVVAFLNSDGGNLIIGVSDDGKILGLKQEIPSLYKNNDKFLLHISNLIKNKIGAEFYDLIDYRIVNVESNDLLLANCKVSPTPCFLNTNDFYVRTGPATDKLEGLALIEYINRHFEQ